MEQSGRFQSGCEAGIYQPLLAYLSAKKIKQFAPPYVPKWEHLPLHLLAKLALLWNEAGFSYEAGELCDFCLKMESFFSLWCPERQFSENQKEKLFSRLKQIPSIPSSPKLDLTLFENPKIRAALTCTGSETGLGVILINGIEIRSFGPQGPNLQFGIQGEGMKGWTRTFFSPEVWLNMNAELQEERLNLKFRFVGINSETPLFMAFYICAENCAVGSEIFLPQTLSRFHGETQKILFGRKGALELSEPLKTQIIPLAGSGCFWNCQFLILFELNPFCSQTMFSFF